MYLMYKAAKKRSQHDYYSKGWVDSPVMQVARQFRVPIRQVLDVIAAQGGQLPSNES